VTGHPSRQHNAWREGLVLGFLVAAIIWVWLAVVDALAGEPFRTFGLLGGIALFTVLHFALNIAYAVLVVAALHRAAREPSLVTGVAFGFFIIEFGFVMLTLLLSHLGLGELAWVRILGGNVLGALVAGTWLFRTHPVAAELRAAERQENE
jgi:hypothetical protein